MIWGFAVSWCLALRNKMSHDPLRRGTIMNVAFIGLGNMGSNIAQCILQAGFDLTVWNRTVSKVQPLVEQGAKRLSFSSASVTSRCNAINRLLRLSDFSARRTESDFNHASKRY